MFLHCIRSLHLLKDVSDFFFFFFFLIQFSCIYLSTFVTCHKMFILCICIVYVRYVFLRFAVFFLTQTGISRLHLLHVMGWFSYVFALYTFVTPFERCI